MEHIIFMILITVLSVNHDVASGFLWCEPCEDMCSCKMSDGSGIVSLRDLDGGRNSIGFPKIQDDEGYPYFYKYNPCTPFTSGGSCKNVLFCQVDQSSGEEVDCGSTSFGTLYDSGAIHFRYESRPPLNRSVVVKVICDRRKTSPQVSSVVESPKDTYNIELYTQCGCPGLCTNNRNEDSTLSLGSVLCILFLVVIVLYLVIGIVYNKYAKSKDGVDLLPNNKFWAGLPSLIMDGFVFTRNQICGGGGQYEELM